MFLVIDNSFCYDLMMIGMVDAVFSTRVLMVVDLKIYWLYKSSCSLLLFLGVDDSCCFDLLVKAGVDAVFSS